MKDNMQVLFYSLFILLIFLLTSININNYIKNINRSVLGVKTENKTLTFWIDFVKQNPEYIPGYIEIGDLKSVKKIDPNYFVDR